MAALTFSADLKASFEKLPHAWEHTVGSDHATMALRADWQQQLKRAHLDLGFKHVRFHGLLDDDMGVLLNENGKNIDSFFNADRVIDSILSIGLKPFQELGFMPSAIASGHTTVFKYAGNVTPPKKMQDWSSLISRLSKHWVDRYGSAEVRSWFFEVWNEPNLKAFWTGTRDEYFELYAATATALKDVDAHLRVGGPATAKNAWIPEFLDACEKTKTPVDFISTHHYPTDALGKASDDTVSELAQSPRHILRDMTRKAHDEARGKPLYYTEWCSSSNPFDELHDQPFAAAYAVKAVMENRGLVEGYSWWTFTDIFEENYLSSKPFHGGFGLMTIHGIPKPVYRAFELLHHLGHEVQPLISSEATEPDVDGWVIRKPGVVHVLLTHMILPRHTASTQMIHVRVKNMSSVKTVYVERIDDTHCNPREKWKAMGSPDYLKAHDVDALEASSSLRRQPIEWTQDHGHVSVQLSLPVQGVACITFEI